MSEEAINESAEICPEAGYSTNLTHVHYPKPGLYGDHGCDIRRMP